MGFFLAAQAPGRATISDILNEHGSEFEYRGSVVRVKTESPGEAFSGHADLHWKGQQKGRVALSTSRLDPVSARLAMCMKARDFIDNWNVVNGSGYSHFFDRLARSWLSPIAPACFWDPEPKRAPKGVKVHPEVGGVRSSKVPARVGCLMVRGSCACFDGLVV